MKTKLTWIVGALAAVGAVSAFQTISTPAQAGSGQCGDKTVAMGKDPGMCGPKGGVVAAGYGDKKQKCADKAVAYETMTSKVTIDQAIKASRERSGGFINEVALKMIDGKPMWKIEKVSDKGTKQVEVHVCGETGKVAKMKTEQVVRAASSDQTL